MQGEQNSSFYHAIDTPKYDLYTACVYGSIAPALLLPLATLHLPTFSTILSAAISDIMYAK